MFAKWVEADGRFEFSDTENGGVEISNELHESVLAGLPEGKLIVCDDRGYPILIDRPRPSMDQLVSAVWEAIKKERDRRKAGGVLVNGHWFKTDDVSRADYLSIKALADALSKAPNDVIRPAWRTLDGSTVDMTSGLATQIIALGAQAWFAIDNIALAHKAALKDCENPASYDYSSGWPTIFGD